LTASADRLKKEGTILLRTVFSAFVFGAAALASPKSEIEEKCAAREILAERLGKRYSERLTSGGLQGDDTLIEVWTSDKTGSFTVLATHANGISCLIAAGSDWDTFTPVPGRAESVS